MKRAIAKFLGTGEGPEDAEHHVFFNHKARTGGFCFTSHSYWKGLMQKKWSGIKFTMKENLQWEDNRARLCNVWMQKLTQSWLQWIDTLISASIFLLLWSLPGNLRCNSSDLLAGGGLPSQQAWGFNRPTAVSLALLFSLSISTPHPS